MLLPRVEVSRPIHYQVCCFVCLLESESRYTDRWRWRTSGVSLPQKRAVFDNPVTIRVSFFTMTILWRAHCPSTSPTQGCDTRGNATSCCERWNQPWHHWLSLEDGKPSLPGSNETSLPYKRGKNPQVLGADRCGQRRSSLQSERANLETDSRNGNTRGFHQTSWHFWGRCKVERRGWSSSWYIYEQRNSSSFSRKHLQTLHTCRMDPRHTTTNWQVVTLWW